MAKLPLKAVLKECKRRGISFNIPKLSENPKRLKTYELTNALDESTRRSNKIAYAIKKAVFDSNDIAFINKTIKLIKDEKNYYPRYVKLLGEAQKKAKESMLAFNKLGDEFEDFVNNLTAERWM